MAECVSCEWCKAKSPAFQCDCCKRVQVERDEIAALRAELKLTDEAHRGAQDRMRLQYERAERLEAEVECMRRLVEAAGGWREHYQFSVNRGPARALADAVDAYRATSEQEATDACRVDGCDRPVPPAVADKGTCNRHAGEATDA